jgi:hypothetical protein
VRILFFILFTPTTLASRAQNLFPVVLNNCKTSYFCLDCGDVKAGYDEEQFRELKARLNESFKTLFIKGVVVFQVLIDSNGKGCVLSHNDTTNNPITKRIIKDLNKFRGWKPAITNNKVSARTSINVVFFVRLHQLDARIEWVDISKLRPTPEQTATAITRKGDSSSIAYGMTLELKNDTLVSDKGQKFYVGQQLILGQPDRADGLYRSIISSKAAIVPAIWGQDKRYEYPIENYVDSKKIKKN